jgi:hypothetical protein
MLSCNRVLRAVLLRPAKPLQRRCQSTASSPLSHLQSLLASHYSHGQSIEHAQDYAEQAKQELRWLEEAARSRTASQNGSTWEKRLESMVEEIVERDKPLAYILGALLRPSVKCLIDLTLLPQELNLFTPSLSSFSSALQPSSPVPRQNTGSPSSLSVSSPPPPSPPRLPLRIDLFVSSTSGQEQVASLSGSPTPSPPHRRYQYTL